MMFKIAFFVLLGVIYVNAENEAIVVLISEDPNVNGTITFKQIEDKVRVQGTVYGLKQGKHGFHVHAKGDLSGGCASTGTHFNPFNKDHGAPTASVRHVGDLGNIEANENGTAQIDITDNQISLTNKETNILGRAVVVHTGEDDLGLTSHPDSKTTGNAGGRIACGIIGTLSDTWDWNSSGTSKASSAILILALVFSSLSFLRSQ